MLLYISQKLWIFLFLKVAIRQKMTSKIFWNAFKLNILTFERILYAHPIRFNLQTKSFTVDNWKRAKYIPLIISYGVVALYLLLSFFNAILGAFEHVPLHYALCNSCVAAVSWNMLFASITFLSNAGQALFEALNALFKEDINNKMTCQPNKIQALVKTRKQRYRGYIHELLSIRKSKGNF